MTARLHVLLGAGGVGKTTLAAAYALALARTPNRRVGLLGIDPSRRLKDALGVALGDQDSLVPNSGALRAAILEPAVSVRRWAAEASSDGEALQRLLRNPFFVAIADRFATATDIFAAARVAEWAEHDPALTDLVVDTAPGLNAIEFLTRPERVAEFLGGRLVGWLRWLARGGATRTSVGPLRGGARRVFGGLTRVGGTHLLLDLAEFFSLIEGVFARMLARVEATQRWLRDESTQILVVTSVRNDGARTASELVDALAGAKLAPRAIVVNRALPDGLARFADDLEAAAADDPLAANVVRYALSYAAMQRRVVQGVAVLATRTVLVPGAQGLDGDARLGAMASIGEILQASLEGRLTGVATMNEERRRESWTS
jgi:anion-transporting  ArsA/GET3 family ATPase